MKKAKRIRSRAGHSGGEGSLGRNAGEGKGQLRVFSPGGGIRTEGILSMAREFKFLA